MNIYESFCKKQHAVLFATDIAARGLGIKIKLNSALQNIVYNICKFLYERISCCIEIYIVCIISFSSYNFNKS